MLFVRRWRERFGWKYLLEIESQGRRAEESHFPPRCHFGRLQAVEVLLGVSEWVPPYPDWKFFTNSRCGVLNGKSLSVYELPRGTLEMTIMKITNRDTTSL